MPGGDRTGPRGEGPRTGRNLGFCAGYSVPGHMNAPGRGCGFGRGWRHRRFWRRDYPYPEVPPPTVAPPVEWYPRDEKAYLEEMMGQLEDQLKQIKARLKELEK